MASGFDGSYKVVEEGEGISVIRQIFFLNLKKFHDSILKLV